MTLDPQLSRAILLVASFRGDDFQRVCAFMLLLGLKVARFNAGDVPADLLQGDRHLAGIATASLLAQDLLEVCGRVRSSSPLANGRKVNELRVKDGRANTVRHWLADRGYMVDSDQMLLTA